ncbi:MAG: LysM domain-containing protein, partial [Candidatus Competibacteraceae bacterium]
MNPSSRYRLTKRIGLTALVLFLSFGLGAVYALGVGTVVDTGSREHARGEYDTVTATYVVVEGDDLIAIGERFTIPVDVLKAHNKLASDK